MCKWVIISDVGHSKIFSRYFGNPNHAHTLNNILRQNSFTLTRPLFDWFPYIIILFSLLQIFCQDHFIFSFLQIFLVTDTPKKKTCKAQIGSVQSCGSQNLRAQNISLVFLLNSIDHSIKNTFDNKFYFRFYSLYFFKFFSGGYLC